MGSVEREAASLLRERDFAQGVSRSLSNTFDEPFFKRTIADPFTSVIGKGMDKVSRSRGFSALSGASSTGRNVGSTIAAGLGMAPSWHDGQNCRSTLSSRVWNRL
jgi:hypothetical protein